MTTTRRRSADRTSLGRLALLLGLLAAAAALTAYAGVATSSPAPDRLRADVPDPAAGKEVFLRDCAWCHGNEGGGTGLGPSLEESGTADADFYLQTGRMPLDAPGQRVTAGPPAYSEETIADLVAFIDTLGVGTPVPTLPDTADPVAGRKLFLSECAACHSSSGTGMILTDGQWAPELFDTPSQQVAEAIRIGPGPMPEFTEQHLTDQDTADVVSYVQQLGDQQVASGASLDQFGPIVEGLFVWLVAMPVMVIVIRLLGKKAPR